MYLTSCCLTSVELLMGPVLIELTKGCGFLALVFWNLRLDNLSGNSLTAKGVNSMISSSYLISQSINSLQLVLF